VPIDESENEKSDDGEENDLSLDEEQRQEIENKVQ